MDKVKQLLVVNDTLTIRNEQRLIRSGQVNSKKRRFMNMPSKPDIKWVNDNTKTEETQLRSTKKKGCALFSWVLFFEDFKTDIQTVGFRKRRKKT